MPQYSRLNPKSNWESFRKDSDWHYDYSKPPESGKDSFTAVGRFDLDFVEPIAEAKTRPSASNFTGKEWSYNIKEDFKKFDGNSLDLALCRGNPYLEQFDRYAANEIKVFENMAISLGLAHSVISLQIQKPGQICAAHVDRQYYVRRMSPEINKIDIMSQPDRLMCFAVMLDDWKIGQFFHFGNAAWHQWNRGECITWDWKNLPHATGNAGYWDRPMLLITGIVTEKTESLMSGCHKDKVLEI